jgi:amidase
MTPTMPEPPWELGGFHDPDNPLHGLFRAGAVVPFTGPFNAGGQPAMNVPLFWSNDGLPIGTQIVGDYGREDLLLRVASQLEEARPWADKRPPL